MNDKRCSTCRWWEQGVRKTEYGTCKNLDVTVLLTESRCGFSPPGDFACGYHEPSVVWAEEAAEEIDDRFQDTYSKLPDEPEERVHLLADIILKSKDHEGPRVRTASRAAR